MAVVNLALHGAHKAEDRRLLMAKAAAREIKLAIDEIRAEYDIDADYPSAITVDRQTFYWSQLVKPEGE
jgi:hypothetical protein